MTELTPALLFGGTSSERRVSVASAQNLARVLLQSQLLYISTSGAVHLCNLNELLAHLQPFEKDFLPTAAAAWPSLAAALQASAPDVLFFLALHGGDGENGIIQAQLQAAQRAFTGSDTHASALAFDKAHAKQQLSAFCIQTPCAVTLHSTDQRQLYNQLLERLQSRGPQVAKPVADGSSSGLFMLPDAAAAAQVAPRIAAANVPYLIEDRIEGVEVTVGVLETSDGNLRALPPTEVRLEDGALFSFANKYIGQNVREITPAELPPPMTAEVQTIAVAAHRALGCTGYSRSDMIVQRSGAVVFLELNTLPGMTRASIMPQQLRAAGISLADFVAQQLQLARMRLDAAHPHD